LFQLLRVAWEQMLAERKLPVYELANKAKCFYFPKERVPNDKVFFTGVDGEKTYRAMVAPWRCTFPGRVFLQNPRLPRR